jgi:hypothetical protein
MRKKDVLLSCRFSWVCVLAMIYLQDVQVEELAAPLGSKDVSACN